MNALLIFIDEPIIGTLMPSLSNHIGDQETHRRYTAIINVLLQQLEGLSNTHVRFCFSPDDAHDAIAFWILPQLQLRGQTIKTSIKGSERSGDFLFTPQKKAPAFTIDFHPNGPGSLSKQRDNATKQAFEEGFEKVAVLHATTPLCGARWINLAFAQTKKNSCVIGPSAHGGIYLFVTSQHTLHLPTSPDWNSQNAAKLLSETTRSTQIETILLPPLTSIITQKHWLSVIESTIGGKILSALKKL